MEEKEFSIIVDALKFSSGKHSNQRRKDREASPYINHPIDVLEVLWNIGKIRDAETLAAGVLHDTIEDTGTTPDEIRDRFGQNILELVLELSDDKSLPKEERKRLQIVNAPHKSVGAKLVKIADKICNLRDITRSPPADWSLERKKEYFNWTEKVVAGLRGVNSCMEAAYDQILSTGRDSLNKSA